MTSTKTTTTKANQIFVNIPTKNVTKSIAFFKKLGFAFNPQFTNEQAGCLILGKNIYAMIISEKMFKTFTKKKISDAHKTTETITALQVARKQEVDTIFNRAINAGAKETRETSDIGWMYSRTFEDLDGHIWELFFMDEKKMPKK